MSGDVGALGDFGFAAPEWGIALWAVAALVVFLAWRSRSDDRALAKLIAPSLRAALLRRASPARRALEIGLLGLACAGFVLALMRPQWGTREISTTRVSAELMIALDVSKSMLAEDVSPSRLERAKAEILDLLPYLDGDQVGLIAFAGRATVLSPLTPDFGFLRLALENAGPHSVTRGGTRLEEPIRRAVAGFGPPGASQRALLLITDGEDHDSFPRDAAKEAAEAGVSIIAIGFGDEGGSPVWFRDPRTGARRQVVDGDGVPIVSRLDGDLLREIALTTDGAYVPAGTGVLDLDAIYSSHLEKLVRGGGETRGRIVRDEGYPWCVLVGLASLLGVVFARARPIEPERTRVAAAVLVAGLALLAVPQPADAQDAEAALDDEALVEEIMATDAGPEQTETLAPRERYNAALAKLSTGEAGEASRELAAARRAAPADPELRYHATYNLGMAATAIANERRPEDPRAALGRLHEAADWFRQAVELRPDSDDARHNLEVTLIDALALEDELARQGERDLDTDLESLGTAQREIGAGIGSLVEAVARSKDTNAADSMRSDFRAAAASQRENLSDADALADRASAERAGLDEIPEEERSPGSAVRAAQLDGVMHYLHRARERMGQTRRDLRRRQPARAYRRGIASVTEIERARDQLREPAALIDVLLRESSTLGRRTQAWAATERAARQLDQSAAQPKLPVSINPDILAEEQGALAERTGELDLRLQAGLAQASQVPPEEAAELEPYAHAEPLLVEARDAQRRAVSEIEAAEHEAALLAQAKAVRALSDAREFFLDLPRLIELAYTDESRIEALVGAERDALEEWGDALLGAQTRNLERALRIDDDVKRGLSQAEAMAIAQQSPGQPSRPDPQAQPVEGPSPVEVIEQLTAASQLMTQVLAGMEEAERRLSDERIDAGRVEISVRRAMRSLAALRRLFMTLAQQVQELAAEQQALGDAVQDALVFGAVSEAEAPSGDLGGSADVAARLGPLLPVQDQLAERGVRVADDLVEQSDVQGGVAVGPDPDADSAPLEPAAAEGGISAENLRLAADHVLVASNAMSDASTALSADPVRGDDGRTAQASALESLAEALALLQPPQRDQQQQDQGEGEQQEGQQPEPQPSEPEAGDNAELASALQSVRDREAERQRDRAARQAAQSETVERDW